MQNASLDKVLKIARTLQRCTPLCTPLEFPPIAAWSNAKHINMYVKHGGNVAKQYKKPQNKRTNPVHD